MMNAKLKPGRNDPCPCGSGKKYKKCCQAKTEAATPELVTEIAPTPAEYDWLIALFNAGLHAELESRTRLLLERYPDSGFAWKILSATLQVQGKDNLRALQKASELMPEDAEVHNNLGLVLQELGRPVDAEIGFRRALQIEPNNADAHYNLGNTLGKLGRPEEVGASYRRALQVKPDFANARFNLDKTTRALGRLGGAAVTHYNLGLVFQEQCRLDEADALELEPNYAHLHYNLGNALLDWLVSSANTA